MAGAQQRGAANSGETADPGQGGPRSPEPGRTVGTAAGGRGTQQQTGEGSRAATEPAGLVVREGLAGTESADYFKLVLTEVALRRPPQQAARAFPPQDGREDSKYCLSWSSYLQSWQQQKN